MKHLIPTALFAVLILTGCAAQPKPQVITVPCRVELPAEPDYPFDRLQPGADIFTQAKTLLADRRLRVAHEAELRAAAKACS